MKKALVLVAALGLLFAVAMPAMALEFSGPSPFKGTFDDFSALYAPPATGAGASTPLGPRVGPAGFTLGNEQRTVFRINSIQDVNNNFDSYYNPATEELTGVLYDLVLVGATAVNGSPTHFVLDFAPLARNPIAADLYFGANKGRDVGTLPGGGAGGVGEVYLGSGATKNFNSNPASDPNTGSTGLPAAPAPGFLSALNSPAQWVQGAAGHAAGGAGADSYPTVTDGTQVLAFEFLPLSYAVLQGLAIPDPTVPLAAGTVLREDLDLASGVGSGFGYANAVYTAGALSNLLGDFNGIPYLDLTLRFNLRFPILDAVPGSPTFGKILPNPDYIGPGEWSVESQDPVRFGVAIPEPATLTLLGLGLAGISGLRLRRRK
jgi:hypothetical protein